MGCDIDTLPGPRAGTVCLESQSKERLAQENAEEKSKLIYIYKVLIMYFLSPVALSGLGMRDV